MAHGAAASNRPAARRGFPDPAGRLVPYRLLLRARRPRSVTPPDKRCPCPPPPAAAGQQAGPAGRREWYAACRRRRVWRRSRLSSVGTERRRDWGANARRRRRRQSKPSWSNTRRTASTWGWGGATIAWISTGTGLCDSTRTGRRCRRRCGSRPGRRASGSPMRSHKPKQ